jgi:hypothetical protein
MLEKEHYCKNIDPALGNDTILILDNLANASPTCLI